MGVCVDGFVVGREVDGINSAEVSDGAGIEKGAICSMVVGELTFPRGGSSTAGAKTGWDTMISICSDIIVGSAVGAKVGKGSIGGGVSSDVEETGMGTARVPGGGIVGCGPVLADIGWGANEGETLAGMAV
jgi:hypothetical protein